MLTRHQQIAAAVVSALCTTIAFAQTPVGYPNPGYYLTDSESITTRGSGPNSAETIERIDGASGNRTVTTKASMDPDHAVTKSYKGTGPESWCVPNLPGKAPAKPLLSACKLKTRTANARGSSESADCHTLKLDGNWRRIDERTWERSLRVTPHSVMASSPRDAIEMGMASMTPDQRGKASAELASLPSAGQINASMAPVIEALEATIRTGSPEEAALARQQLQALRTPSGDLNISGDFVTQVRERWTRVADTCPKER